MTEAESPINVARSHLDMHYSITPVNKDQEKDSSKDTHEIIRRREDTDMVHLPPINQNVKVPSHSPCPEIKYNSEEQPSFERLQPQDIQNDNETKERIED